MGSKWISAVKSWNPARSQGQNGLIAGRPSAQSLRIFQSQLNFQMRVREGTDAGSEMILRQKRKRANAERLARGFLEVMHFCSIW